MKYQLTLSFTHLDTLREITKALELVGLAFAAEKEGVGFAAVGDVVEVKEPEPAGKSKVVDIAAEKAERKTRKAEGDKSGPVEKIEKSMKAAADKAKNGEGMSLDEERDAALNICRDLFHLGTDAAVRDVKKLRDEMGVEKLTYITAADQVREFVDKAYKLRAKHAKDQPKGAA